MNKGHMSEGRLSARISLAIAYKFAKSESYFDAVRVFIEF